MVSLAATQLLLPVAEANKGPQHFNGKYYEFIDTLRTWDQALADAKSRTFQGHQGTLVRVYDNHIMAFIKTLRKLQGLPNYNYRYPLPKATWVGLHGDKTDNIAKWTDGTPWWNQSKMVYGHMGTAMASASGVSYTNYRNNEVTQFNSHNMRLYRYSNRNYKMAYAIQYDTDDDCGSIDCGAGNYCHDLNGTHGTF